MTNIEVGNMLTVTITIDLEKDDIVTVFNSIKDGLVILQEGMKKKNEKAIQTRGERLANRLLGK